MATDEVAAPADTDLVHIDSIGTPASHQDTGPVNVLLIGVGDASRQRLDELEGFILVDPPDADDPDGAAAEPDMVLVSTRLPRNEAVAAVASYCRATPVIALVHTGGETLAADLLRAGARGLLAEGNEGTVRSFLDRNGEDTGLLEVYDRHIGRTQILGGGQRSQDTVTGLPNETAFDSRVTEAQLAGDVPRIGFIRLLFLEHGDLRAQASAVVLVRRRLALQFQPVINAYDVELFALSDTTFAFVGAELSPNSAELLGKDLATIASSFAPWGVPLAVAVGHAGSEVSQDPSTVRQLAERAVEVAALEQTSTVVGAETLSLGASSTTELEAALGLVDVVERHDPQGHGQAAQIAELAVSIAWALGYEGRAGAAIRLAAHLHDIGKVGLTVPAMFPAADLGDEAMEEARSHPVRAAEYLRPLAGAEIAAAVRAHHERWDGTGFPDGLVGDEIPVAARIIAIAGDYLRMAHDHGPSTALEHIMSGVGQAYDPSIVEVATPLMGARSTGAAPGLAGARR